MVEVKDGEEGRGYLSKPRTPDRYSILRAHTNTMLLSYICLYKQDIRFYRSINTIAHVREGSQIVDGTVY